MICKSILEAFPARPAVVRQPSVALLVDQIGSATIWQNLIDFLHSTTGGIHCVVWQLGRDGMNQVGAASWNGTDHAHRRLCNYIEPKFWGHDPALQAVREQPDRRSAIIVRMDPRIANNTLIRKILYGQDGIRERLVICQIRPESTFGLSVVRDEHEGPFSRLQIHALESVADTLLSILLKHNQIASVYFPGNPVSEKSIPEIERCLRTNAPHLPQRESQVCARLICGRQMPAIAVELGVSSETIETYRKRAYERLRVANKQELLLRYLRYH